MARKPKPDTFPRAPTQAEWDAMSPKQRAQVVASLPGEVTDAEMSPPEGDRHFLGKSRALDALKGFFGRKAQPVYLASELPVYYPGERRFAPDLLAVVGAEQLERDKWVMSAEGRGLDFVMEVHVGGDRKKDAKRNVARYARLSIPEYFIYDRARQQLLGYRLPGPGAHSYVPIHPVQGRLPSERLGLGLQLEGERLRFYDGDTPLPESAELIARLEGHVAGLQQRVEEEARLRQHEAQRRKEEAQRRKEEARRREDAERRLAAESRLREQEARRRADAERRLKQLQAELKRLRAHPQ